MLRRVTLPHVQYIAKIRCITPLSSVIQVLERSHRLIVKVGLIYAHVVGWRVFGLSGQSDFG